MGIAVLFSVHSYADTSQKTQQVIKVFVTVDWEGWSLDDENIEAMQIFRKKFPHIPLMQLLNPVYLLRQSSNVDADASKIRSTFLPADTYGLHIHGWKSLLDYCQIPYQSSPSYAHANESCDGGECGYTVSLEYGYTEDALIRLVGCSAELLVQQGFERPRYFRAGGWQLGPKLANALEMNDFTFDSSRTDANLLTTKWAENSGLVQMIKTLHPESSALDQPYPLTVHVMEYPNNGSLADYTDTHRLLEIFNSLIMHNKNVLVLGFHQETSFSYLKILEDAIPLFEKAAQEAHVKLEWVNQP